MNLPHTSAFERITSRLAQWVRDPFGRKRITSRHNEVLIEMREVKTLVESTTKKYENQTSFPIGDMVGSRNLRRKRKKDGNT